MKISLKNFRCHRNAEYEFPDSGLVLLQSDSGSGKTTILEAITYALYGSELITKPYSHGAKTCKVTLEIFNITIERTSTPNTLSVKYENGKHKDKIEAEEAQEFIYKLIGMKSEEFLISSYIKQGIESSILLLSPAKQLEVIEILAFSDQSHLIYKNCIKQLIQKRKDEIIKYETHIDALGNIPDQNLVTNLKKPKFSSKQLIAEQEKIQKRIDILKQDDKRLARELSATLQVEKKIIENSKLQKKFKIEIEQLMSLREKLKLRTDDEIKDIEHRVSNLKKEVDDYSQTLAAYEKYTYTQSLIKEYFDEISKKIKTTKITDTIKDIDEQLKQHESSIADVQSYEHAELEYKKAVREIKTFIDDPPLDDVEEFIDCLFNFKKDIQEHIQKQAVKTVLEDISPYLCTKCEHTIKKKFTVKSANEYQNQDLKEVLSMIDISIDRISKLKSILAKKYSGPKSADIKKMIDALTAKKIEVKKSQADIKKWQSIIDGNILPVNLLKMKNECLVGDDIDVQSLTKKHTKASKNMAILEKELQAALDENNAYHRYTADIDSKNEKIKTCEESTHIMLSETLSYAITDINNKIASEHSYLQTVFSEIMNAKIYEEYDHKRQDIIDKHNHLDEYKKKLEQTMKNLEADLELETIYREAENLALEHTLDAINNYAKIYLDQLFTEHIIVRLENIKTSKNGSRKYQMNTYVEYRGEKFDRIGELSGGEKQRVNLAFILAINDLIGGKLLFMDECTNNLSTDHSLNIFTFLKNMQKQKLVIVVSHEEIAGVFDSVKST